MSSIVTAVPSGLIEHWCVKPWYHERSYPQKCRLKRHHSTEDDFQTICCDGEIIDVTRDLSLHYAPLNITNLACCRIQNLSAGLAALPRPLGTVCEAGTQVPLTSLAATNTKNVENYLVTYKSASYGPHTTADLIRSKEPKCLWAYTARGAQLSSVTVPAAQFTAGSPSSNAEKTEIMGSKPFPTSGSSGTVSGSTAGATSKTSGASSGSEISITVLLVLGLVVTGSTLVN